MLTLDARDWTTKLAAGDIKEDKNMQETPKKKLNLLRKNNDGVSVMRLYLFLNVRQFHTEKNRLGVQ